MLQLCRGHPPRPVVAVSNRKELLRWLAFAALYFALHAVPTVLYGDRPALRGANAVAAFLLLATPRRDWVVVVPLLWLGAAAARLTAGVAQPWMLGACNALEVLAVAAVLHGRNGLECRWYGRTQLLRLVAAAGLVPLCTGALAAWAGAGHAGASFGARWLGWYAASMLAYLTLAPFFLSWAQRALPARDEAPPPLPQPRRVAGIVLIAVACIALLRQELYPPALLLSFPLVVLSAWWYRLPGATTVIACLAVAGGWFADREVGALVQYLQPVAPLTERVQAVQLYVAAVVLCSLPFAMLLAEQDVLWTELNRKSDARAEFLAAMSHEIRTPLTGVLGMADMLAAQPLSGEQRRYVEAMRSSGRHLVSVVNDILDYSRIETGKLTLERIEFRLDEVVEQLRSLLQPTALEKGLNFAVWVAPELPSVLVGDPTRLRQILLNLAGNAVKFTARGGVAVELTAAARNTRLRVTVRDSGIGIPADKLPLLFTPFTQADRSTARRFGGSGLGLAISARLAAAMDGQITVESTPGEGSVFTLDLPLQPGDPGRRPAAGPEALAMPAPQRILVAEDVELNRDILRLALGAYGHHVVFAHDGAEALELVQAEPFDMVLMDVQMPVLDGVEATRRIRRLPGALGRIPIIGLTANVMSQEQARYLQAGMDACLGKPIEWDRLAAAIARHAGRPAAPEDIASQLAPMEAISPAEAAAPPPLLDRAQFDSVRAMAGSDADFRLLLETCLVSVERALGEIDATFDPGSLGAVAHRLKGTAGMMGLARLCAAANELEVTVMEGREALAPRLALLHEAQQAREVLVREMAVAAE